MEKIQEWLQPYEWLLEGDFNRGYFAGVVLVILIIISLLILRIIYKSIFRRRRTKEILIPMGDGNVTVAVGAITQTVVAILANFPAIFVRDTKVYRLKKRYFLELFVAFDPSLSSNFPEDIPKIKLEILKGLESTFGIKSIYKINIKIEKLSNKPSFEKEEKPQAEVADEELNSSNVI